MIFLNNKNIVYSGLVLLIFCVVLVSGCSSESDDSTSIPEEKQVNAESGYKTFNNSYMSFEYPSSWNITVAPSGQNVKVKNLDSTNEMIEVTQYSTKSDYLADMESQEFDAGPGVEETGNDGITYTTFSVRIMDSDLKYYYFEKDDMYYVVGGLEGNELDKLVSSIK